MKKSIFILLISILSCSFIFTACGHTKNNVAKEQNSMLAQQNNDSLIQLSKEDALAIITDILNPEENYTAEVTDDTVQINGKEYYIVTVSQNEKALSPSAAVDAASGEYCSYYEDKTLGKQSELPFLTKSAVAKSWTGKFERTDNTAKIELEQSDDHSFEFSLEMTKGGITTKVNGVAEIGETTASFTGTEGLVLDFKLENETLTISPGKKNTASDAIGYTGSYILQNT